MGGPLCTFPVCFFYFLVFFFISLLMYSRWGTHTHWQSTRRPFQSNCRNWNIHIGWDAGSSQFIAIVILLLCSYESARLAEERSAARFWTLPDDKYGAPVSIQHPARYVFKRNKERGELVLENKRRTGASRIDTVAVHGRCIIDEGAAAAQKRGGLDRGALLLRSRFRALTFKPLNVIN